MRTFTLEMDTVATNFHAGIRSVQTGPSQFNHPYSSFLYNLQIDSFILAEVSQPPSPIMPRAEFNKFKGKEEHLIFVKNVPAYLANRSIPDLYGEYDPVRFKNVYPHSDITTVVIGFRTHEEAVHAQQETDGVRLESVVLRVEMYNKHRSVRYLQENRTKGRPLGATYNDFEEEEDGEEAVTPKPEYLLPFGAATEKTSGAKTWARIAGNNRASNGMMPLPPPVNAMNTRHPTPVDDTAKSTPTFVVAAPYTTTLIKIEATNSEASTTKTPPEHSPKMPSIEVARCESDVEEDHKTKSRPAITKANRPMPSNLFAPWEPINSTQRFSLLHCRDCTFCKMRERSKAERRDQYWDPEKIL
jgi:hypothetical protein